MLRRESKTANDTKREIPVSGGRGRVKFRYHPVSFFGIQLAILHDIIDEMQCGHAGEQSKSDIFVVGSKVVTVGSTTLL